MKEFEFTSILGWSVSRYDLFKTCKRQYYYNYYASHDPRFPKKKIIELKNMTSTALETGNIVHDVYKTLLERLQRNESAIDKERFFTYLGKITDEYCRSKTFAECYYGQYKKPDIKGILDRVITCLTNFFSTDRFSWILNEAIKTREQWIIEPPGFGETRIDGKKAYCKVDFLFPVEGKIFIFDWKTGKFNREKHQKQMLGYAAWASGHFEVKPEVITSIIAYLYPEYKEIQLGVTRDDLKEFTGMVKRETELMYAFCRDVKKNVPKEKDLFVKQVSKLCDYCNFRELCGI